MRVAVRKDHQVARRERGAAGRGLQLGLPLDDEVINQQALRACRQQRCQLLNPRGLESPRRRELTVEEDGAGQAHGVQYLGQGIHR